jgi:hypothetical protein
MLKFITSYKLSEAFAYFFGHVHEGYGAQVIRWEKDGVVFGEQAIAWGGRGTSQMNAYPESSNWPIKGGRETLMVNAATMNEDRLPHNAPWPVDFDLPWELSSREERFGTILC